MKLLLDECVTRYLKRDLIGHDVSTVDEAGFKGLKNGALLRAADGNFDVLNRGQEYSPPAEPSVVSNRCIASERKNQPV